jgi:hypothetical protein
MTNGSKAMTRNQKVNRGLMLLNWIFLFNGATPGKIMDRDEQVRLKTPRADG